MCMAGCGEEAAAEANLPEPGSTTASPAGEDTGIRSSISASASASSGLATTGTGGSEHSDVSTSGVSATTAAGEEDAGSDTGVSVPITGCPESWPGDWIVCEDFEASLDVRDIFGRISGGEDRITVAEGAAVSGVHALALEHVPGVFASGSVDLRFGHGPAGDPHVAQPEGVFRELWVRFYAATSSDWPDAGLAAMSELMVVSPDRRAIAVDAAIDSPSSAELRAIAWSCVTADGRLGCTGDGDYSNPNMRRLEDERGTTPLYGAAAAGQWHCHEMHVRLDDAGESNGVFEVFVDGDPEIEMDELPFVRNWDGAALNTLRFSAVGNVAVPLHHYIDDVVVSHTRVGCITEG